MASNEVKTEVVQESEITEEIMEETIETNFKTQRLYLEKHIEVSDLIAYYELFSQEERRKLHYENNVNREAAARLAFNMIEERTQTDKYTQLLFALEDAGCPKLIELLKGKLVPRNSVNRQRINTATKHICERLTPSNILHYLVSSRVITFGESERIAKKERNESRTHAALDLLFILPNRSKDWYTLFLWALVEGDEHTQLAELIDQKKAAQIKAQMLAGMNTRICDTCISLQNPIHDKQVTQSHERLSETTDKSPGVRKYDESEHRTSSGTKGLWCDMCNDAAQDMIPAYGFCSECNIFICKSCDDNHRKWPILQKHVIVQSGQLPKPQAYKPGKYLECNAHSDRVKDHYCVEHNEFTCTECIKQTHQSCNTFPLRETSSAINIIAIKDFVSVVDNLTKDGLLTKSAFENHITEIDQQKEDLIKRANEERDKIISRARKINENTVSMIYEACEQKHVYVTERIISLANIIHSLDEINTDIKRKCKIKFDQNLIIRMHQHVDKVEEYKSAIENMNKETRKITLSFSPSSEVSTFLSVSKSLGTVKEIKVRSDISQVSVNKLSSLDIRLKQDKETCITRGIAVTSKGVVLLTDSNNKSVKSFSQDNKLLSSLTFSGGTCGISVINDQTATVSTYNNRLHILNISDPANISIDRSVSLDYMPGGMTHYKGNLIVTKCDEPQYVKMIDLNGQEKWSISVDQLFDKPYSVTISTSNDTSTIIVTDWDKRTLTLIDPNDGHLIKTIDVKGKQPLGLTSDNDGNVYVCYPLLREICVFSPDFEKSRILLSSSDLRGHPTDIVYCSNSDVLYIAYKNNDTLDCFQLA